MPETDPAITPRCASCGSDALVPDAFLIVAASSAMTFKVGIYTDPSAKLLKKPVMTDAGYRVCGDCGFIAMVAHDPRTLWDGYMDRLSRDLD